MGTKLAPCPCGAAATWQKAAMEPEKAPEHAVCLLTDEDFRDNYCDACFGQAVPPNERAGWKRLQAA